jgi:hypothetical protein
MADKTVQRESCLVQFLVVMCLIVDRIAASAVGVDMAVVVMGRVSARAMI